LREKSTSGISPSFLGLSRSSRWVTHVLLTRSRLCPGASPGSSLHLHVLSTPPAFVLSQDQTLREVNYTDTLLRARRLTKSCHASCGTRRTRLVPRYDGISFSDPAISAGEDPGVEPGRAPPTRLSRKARMLLSFQRPSRPVGKGSPSKGRSPRAEALGSGPRSVAPLGAGCGLRVRPDSLPR
jgi:hypothetical protein